MIDFSKLEIAIEKAQVKEPPKHRPKTSGIASLDVQAKYSRTELEQMSKRVLNADKRYNQAGHVKASILIGMNQGESLAVLFLKAVEYISLVTEDQGFYSQARKRLIETYGIGLENPKALEIELEETKARLDKLKSSLEAKRETSEARNITSAIKAHKQQIEALEKKISELKEIEDKTTLQEATNSP